MAQHLHVCGFPKSPLEVTNISTVTADVLDKGIVNALKQKSSHLTTVCLTKSASYNGLNYRCGMILVHGSLGGLSTFIEIIQMVILEDQLLFLVRKLDGWYIEHYRYKQMFKDLTNVYKIFCKYFQWQQALHNCVCTLFSGCHGKFQTCKTEGDCRSKQH